MPQPPPRPKVLIVDDNPDNLDYAQRVLEGQYQVELASSGTEGLDGAARTPPALILLDIELPRRDGFQILREIRHDPSLRGIPVVACTANGLIRQREERPSGRFDAFLFKPYRPSELTELVASLLDPGADPGS